MSSQQHSQPGACDQEVTLAYFLRFPRISYRGVQELPLQAGAVLVMAVDGEARHAVTDITDRHALQDLAVLVFGLCPLHGIAMPIAAAARVMARRVAAHSIRFGLIASM